MADTGHLLTRDSAAPCPLDYLSARRQSSGRDGTAPWGSTALPWPLVIGQSLPRLKRV
jgi:hypothetical protein